MEPLAHFSGDPMAVSCLMGDHFPWDLTKPFIGPFSERSYGNLIPYERPSPIGSHEAIKFSSFSGGSCGSLIPYERPSRASWDLTETSLLAHFLGDPMEISPLMRDHFPRISRGHWLIFWKILRLWESHTLWGIIFHSLDPQSRPDSAGTSESILF